VTKTETWAERLTRPIIVEFACAALGAVMVLAIQYWRGQFELQPVLASLWICNCVFVIGFLAAFVGQAKRFRETYYPR
jgi:hypothetical protein